MKFTRSSIQNNCKNILFLDILFIKNYSKNTRMFAKFQNVKSGMLKAQKYRLAYANLIHATNTPCVFLWIIIYLLPMVIYQFYMACEWQKAKAMTYFQATKSINFWKATQNELVFVLNAKWNNYKNVKMIKMDLFKQELICTSYYEKIETI